MIFPDNFHIEKGLPKQVGTRYNLHVVFLDESKKNISRKKRMAIGRVSK